MLWRNDLEDFKKRLPYSYIPIPANPENMLTDRVPLDTTIPEKITGGENERYSGKLHCRLLVKGPFCIGDMQTDAPNGEKCISPFMIGNRFAIPRSSLRGMIRAFYETWQGDPMSRVARRSFWFRPNMAFGPRGQNRVAIVASIDEQGLPDSAWILPSLDYNRTSPEYGDILWLREIPAGITIAPRLLGHENVKCRYAESADSYTFPVTNGLDGAGRLASWFHQGGHGYKAIRVRRDMIDGHSFEKINISPKIASQYRKLYEELSKAAGDHPLTKDPNPSCRRQKINQIQDSMTNIWRCTVGDILFMEMESTKGKDGKVHLVLRTFGRTFRYPWLFDRTTSCSDFPDEISFLFKGEDLKKKLAKSRELFGYSFDDEVFDTGFIGTLPPAEIKKLKSGFRAKAGKVHFNEAILVCGDKQILENRHLPRPGKPQASFFPVTLQQGHKILKHGGHDPMMMFGDPLSSSGDNPCSAPRLAGRKRYRSSVIVNFLPIPDVNGHGVCLEKVLVPNPDGGSDPEFRFTTSFECLTRRELSELLFALDLGDDNNLVHQLGYGKEYGMGAVKIEIEKTSLFIFDAQGLREWDGLFKPLSGLKPLQKELKEIMHLHTDAIPPYPDTRSFNNLKTAALKERKSYGTGR